jgi:lipopolysaccharide transport system ATP-binding protein
MGADPLIKVEGVSKKFCRSLRHSLLYGVQDLAGELRGRSVGTGGNLRPAEFWALQDVSLQVRRGECLGLIGRNGAGKSTLLKLLTGLLKPDAGRISIRGRVASLIELGAGFNPILTGRENIYVNGSALGFSRAELKRRFDEIVEFSELESFIDTPVQHYSSGMKIRLGFSVAAHLEPDVLFLDEVLAVGDAGFRMKSYNKMEQLIQKSAVIFVSHAMAHVARVASHVMLIDQGSVAYFGRDISCGMERYMDLFSSGETGQRFSDGASIHDIRIQSSSGSGGVDGVPLVHYGDEVVFRILLSVDTRHSEFGLGYIVTDREMRTLGGFSTLLSRQTLPNTGKPMWVEMRLKKAPFTNGEYRLSLRVETPTAAPGDDRQTTRVLGRWDDCAKFRVRGFRGAQFIPLVFDTDVESV